MDTFFSPNSKFYSHLNEARLSIARHFNNNSYLCGIASIETVEPINTKRKLVKSYVFRNGSPCSFIESARVPARTSS